MTKSIPSSRFAAVLAVGLLVVAFVPAALAAKGGKPGGGDGSSSIALVLVDSPDALPNHGERVTFAVSTTSTDRPFVSVNCHQGGVWVYSASAGFFPDYPWSREFILSSTSWPAGAADCRARLYMTKDGRRTTTLATLDFHVYA